MQDDVNQPEEEQQSLSEKKDEEKQPEQEQQPVSGDAADESQARSQPPPAAPTPLPLTQQEKRRQYFLGLGFGLIPVIVFLVTFGIGELSQDLGTLILGGLAAILLYIVELITTIVFFNKRQRFAGYGLLTAFLVTPIITAIGCTVIPQVIHP